MNSETELPTTDSSAQPLAAPDARPAAPKISARRRSRELAVMGLYQWLVGGDKSAAAEAHIREQDGFEKCDRAHFELLLHGCLAEAATLDVALERHLDRKTAHLSPVEHAVMLIGAYELRHCVDIPYRVVINEAVEVAKSFGGTDGHKYVNGVLDKASADLRPDEVRSPRTVRRPTA
jgi:N utilization substance protein B